MMENIICLHRLSWLSEVSAAEACRSVAVRRSGDIHCASAAALPGSRGEGSEWSAQSPEWPESQPAPLAHLLAAGPMFTSDCLGPHHCLKALGSQRPECGER